MLIKIFISYYNYDKGKMNSLKKHIDKHDFMQATVVAEDRRASTPLSDKVKEGIKSATISYASLQRSPFRVNG